MLLCVCSLAQPPRPRQGWHAGQLRVPYFDRVEAPDSLWCPWCLHSIDHIPAWARERFACANCERPVRAGTGQNGRLFTEPVREFSKEQLPEE